jgi:general secretion pathway protein K
MSKTGNQTIGLQSKHGFVLFTVIWLVAAIAVITATFVTRSQNAKILQRALSFNRQLEMAADGFVRLQAFRLAKLPLGVSLDVRGTVDNCVWSENVHLFFSIQDQAGLVDINTASLTTIKTVLVGSGADALQALTLSQAIVDYRDPDSISNTGGSELAHYSKTGPFPSNLPFVAIEELDRIPALSDNIFSKLLQTITVHSQQQGVDPATVPDGLLRILSGSSNKLPDTLQSPSPKRVFAITVKAKRQGGGHFTRHAIVAVTGQPDRPFTVLKWAKRDEDFLSANQLAKNKCF